MRNPRDPAAEIPLDGLEGFKEGFLLSRKEELISLQSALVEMDYLTMIKMAHKWKGFATPYGFGELSYLSVELEKAAEEKDLEACRSIIQHIEEYLDYKSKSTSVS